MTSIDEIVRELRDLLEKATPGPWQSNSRMQRVEQDLTIFGRDYRAVASPYNANADADGALIAAARNHLPALLSALARSRRQEEALREIADHWACAYDHKYANTEAYRGSYGIGITDGHRAAAIIARAALEDNPNG